MMTQQTQVQLKSEKKKKYDGECSVVYMRQYSVFGTRVQHDVKCFFFLLETSIFICDAFANVYEFCY